MTKRTKTLPSGDDPNELVELSGDITDYWSYSMVRDYVLLMKGLSHTALRLYLVLRSMIREASSWPRGGMRRMTIDQLCWLLPGTGPDDKPISISAMYGLLDALEKADLVHQKDAREVEGASKLKGKEKAARGIARGLEVKDLPPVKYEGWRNAWDKLDAYRPDWRENPPTPPTHVTEVSQSEDGRISTRVRPVSPGGSPFQKTGTAQVKDRDGSPFQKTGTAFQDPGTASQIPGTNLALTSENDHPLTSSLEEALSSQGAPTVSDTPPTSAKPKTEREIDAARNIKATSVPVQEASIPAPRPELQPHIELVVAAYTDALSPVLPMKSVLERLRSEAEQLLSLNWPADHVAKLAGQMPGQRYVSLAKHAEFNPPPAPKAARKSGPPACERHPAFEARDCLRCAADEREQLRREQSDPAGVDGAGLLARLRSGQSAS